MFFFQGSNSRLREIQEIQLQLNDIGNDQNRTMNTDSLSRLFYVRKRKIQELMRMHIAEEAALIELNRRGLQVVMPVQGNHAENIHADEENVI